MRNVDFEEGMCSDWTGMAKQETRSMAMVAMNRSFFSLNYSSICKIYVCLAKDIGIFWSGLLAQVELFGSK